MPKSTMDHQALIEEFASAGKAGSEKLRIMVRDATLKAIQSREVTATNLRQALKAVTAAASTGAARNTTPGLDPESLIATALAGIDAAMLQTVTAQRNAVQQFVDQGVALQDRTLKQALSAMEKMEDTFLETVRKTVSSGNNPLQAAWLQALSRTEAKGTATGAKAASAVEEMMLRSQENMRAGRQAAADAANTLLKSYGALVSGVLIGLSEGLAGSGKKGATDKRGRQADSD